MLACTVGSHVPYIMQFVRMEATPLGAVRVLQAVAHQTAEATQVGPRAPAHGAYSPTMRVGLQGKTYDGSHAEQGHACMCHVSCATCHRFRAPHLHGLGPRDDESLQSRGTGVVGVVAVEG